MLTRNTPSLWQPNMMTNWDPITSLARDVFNTSGFSTFPKVNVNETSKYYHLKASLPGMKKEDIKVEFDNEHLILRGDFEEDKVSDPDAITHIKEITSGSFFRKIYMPEADVEKVVSNYENGILKLDVHKKKGSSTRKTIQI